MAYSEEVKHIVKAAIVDLQMIDPDKNNKENLRLLKIARVKVLEAIRHLQQ